MQCVVLANEVLKQELGDHQNIIWASSFDLFIQHKDADAFIDLEFENNTERIKSLKRLFPKPVIINSVIETLQEISESFIRINAWPTFLKGNIIEASAAEDQKQNAEEIFNSFNKKIEWLPDQIGFITPRVICSIINEAFFALGEKVSTKEEIDTAMKLGTNYPYGPFEWTEIIGAKNIYGLLEKLSKDHTRYTPSDLLKESI